MNRKRVLDTNRLINHWCRSRKRPLTEYTREDAANWAGQLIVLDGSNAILTPVRIEFLCGVRFVHEYDLSLAFLGEFKVIDEGKITESDWIAAERRASRIPGDRSPRQMADCLIAAIAKRLGYETITGDKGFQR